MLLQLLNLLLVLLVLLLVLLVLLLEAFKFLVQLLNRIFQRIEIIVAYRGWRGSGDEQERGAAGCDEACCKKLKFHGS